MSKVYSDPTAALDGLLHDNMTIAAGGFGLCGIPENLIAALRENDLTGLTLWAPTRAWMGWRSVIASTARA